MIVGLFAASAVGDPPEKLGDAPNMGIDGEL